MDDPRTWSSSQMEAWLELPADKRLGDLRQLQAAAFAIKPTAFNRRKWTDATARFTRLVLLELRANVRSAVDACMTEIEAGRIDPKTRGVLDEHGGPEFLETLVAVAFTQIQDGFEHHDWQGSGVSATEQATRLMFVGERIEQLVVRNVRTDGITEDFFSSLKSFCGRQLQAAFSTPAGEPMPVI